MRTFLLLTLFGCSTAHPDLSLDRGENAAYERDDDADGYGISDDCDDADAAIHPGATEICDTVDNDCDDAIDDADNSVVENWWAPDRDADTFTIENGIIATCEITSLEEFAEELGADPADLADWAQVTQYDSSGQPRWDCDDDDANTYPGATEICDGVVNDCDSTSTTADDGLALTDYYVDADLDGFGDEAGTAMQSCDSSMLGYAASNDDCDDGDDAINPAAYEICDADDVDEDCDGYADDGDPEGDADGLTDWYTDADLDGYGTGSVTDSSCDGGTGLADNADDCDDADASVSTEHDWYYDYDGDGHGSTTIVSPDSCSAPSADWTDLTGDCDDSDAAVNPDATEAYNGLDDDCDGLTDEDVSCDLQFFIFGGALTSVTADFSDDSMDGEWYPTTMSGVSYSATAISADESMHEFDLDLCLGGATVLLAITFEDGTVACDIEETVGSGLYFATQDGSDLAAVNVEYDDNGDGTNDRCAVMFGE